MPALVVPQQQQGDAQPNQSPTQPTSASQPRKTSNPTVKTKKDGTIKSNAPPPPAKEASGASQSQMKKLSRKSSKPIINWFQRKLAGTVRARRASDGDALRARAVSASRPATLKDQRRRSSVPAVPPMPGLQTGGKHTKSIKSQTRPLSVVASTKRNTISLDGSDDFSSMNDERTVDSAEDYRSSLARESLWSPTSLSVREADEDASVRPLPPSAPPSPSPSHSSSSYLSDPRTFASMSASTKPTTVLSVDLTGGMAHIAQAPPTPTIPGYRLGTHTRSHSTAPSTGGSITFSNLPATASPSPPSSSAHGPTSRGSLQQITVHAPQHTTHHPRNNPRPSSPPLDDASMLTLASSAFGVPGARQSVGVLMGRRSVADDSISHFSGAAGLGDSASHFLLGELEDDERMLEALDRDGDVDASVRALRPRSSRRGSWESEASKWSAHFGNGPGLPGTPSLVRERSLWTSGSLRTGTRSVNLTEEEMSQEKSANADESSWRSEENYDEEEQSLSTLQKEHVPPSTNELSTPTTSSMSTTTGETTETGTPKEKGLDTPKVSALTLENALPPLPTTDAEDRQSFHDPLPTPNQTDKQSLLSSTTDAHTDLFVSAPSTPLPV